MMVFQWVYEDFELVAYTTQRLQSSSSLVMTYFLLRDYNIQPKKELLWSLWVVTRGPRDLWHPSPPKCQSNGLYPEISGSFPKLGALT